MKFIICLVLACCIFFGCENKSQHIINRLELADTLFPIEHISNLDSIDVNAYDKFEMDTLQKQMFAADAVFYEEAGIIDRKYISSMMHCNFIAKQHGINGFLPIVFSIQGDDYSANYLVVLDSNLKYTSHLKLSGGINAGPIDETDSTVTLPIARDSKIYHSTIKWYRRHETIYKFSKPQKAKIDSVVFVSEILSSGKIKTERKDSVTYTRLTK